LFNLWSYGTVRSKLLYYLFGIIVHFLYLPKENEPKEMAPVSFDPLGNLRFSVLPKICNLKSRFFYGTTCDASANDNGKVNNFAHSRDDQILGECSAGKRKLRCSSWGVFA